MNTIWIAIKTFLLFTLLLCHLQVSAEDRETRQRRVLNQRFVTQVNEVIETYSNLSSGTNSIEYAQSLKTIACRDVGILSSLGTKTEAVRNLTLNQRTMGENLRYLRSSLISARVAELEDYGYDESAHHDTIARLESTLASREGLRREALLCLFNDQLKDQISNQVGSNRELLQRLSGISTCFEPNVETQPENLRELASHVFQSIFNFFSGKEELTEQDCEVLKQTYSVWSTFYENDNEKRSSDEAIPFYNVNSHNSAYFYWMRERQNGNIPPGGLSLVHLDTHTDLQHVHGFGGGTELSRIALPDITNLLYELNQNGVSGVTAQLNNLTYLDPATKQAYLEYVSGHDAESLRTTFEVSVRNSVHRIAQPLMGAALSDVSRDFIFVKPPWSQSVETSELIEGRAYKQELTLLSDKNGDISFHTPNEGDQLGLRKHNVVDGLSGFAQRAENQHPALLNLGSVSLSITDANTEAQVAVPNGNSITIQEDRELEPLSTHLTTERFILDIDLDGFVSQGQVDRRGNENIQTPESFERTIEDHSQSNETDENIFVSAVELDLIDSRIDSFIQRLEEAKTQGHLPAVITISDSTVLQRAAEGQREDSMSGGNFTPSCLAFLLNYRVRQRLNEVYNLEIPQ
ncbi:MAG: hypothetical protein CME65_02780 [Halobacteriovoraceae bacterium]|nr:hypothetical protein [Halobacteriovoraceae bacterium]|tara:strand:+ start:19665 stop:21566 length:1902 start_codon:yes stop_codon:yes gene_type:complete